MRNARWSLSPAPARASACCGGGFVRRGYATALADVNEEAGRAVEAELREWGECSFFLCDVSDDDTVRTAVGDTVATYGHLDERSMPLGSTGSTEDDRRVHIGESEPGDRCGPDRYLVLHALRAAPDRQGWGWLDRELRLRGRPPGSPNGPGVHSGQAWCRRADEGGGARNAARFGCTSTQSVPGTFADTPMFGTRCRPR